MLFGIFPTFVSRLDVSNEMIAIEYFANLMNSVGPRKRLFLDYQNYETSFSVIKYKNKLQLAANRMESFFVQDYFVL